MDGVLILKVKNLNNHIEHIVNGYKQQYLCYQQLLQLSQRHTSLTSENNIDEILEILRQKEEVINSIKELDQNISLHKKVIMDLLHLNEFHLDKVQDLIYINLRNELNEQRAAIEHIITTILETDQKNEEDLRNLKRDVAKELKSIQQHHELQQTYFDLPEKFPEPLFFDKKK